MQVPLELNIPHVEEDDPMFHEVEVLIMKHGHQLTTALNNLLNFPHDEDGCTFNLAAEGYRPAMNPRWHKPEPDTEDQ